MFLAKSDGQTSSDSGTAARTHRAGGCRPSISAAIRSADLRARPLFVPAWLRATFVLSAL
jgi:hypothetical protein